jgi:predicted unusual protein kinase regulating ubiquinone biosynthesis (AarF/ABC1/UbiB family)
MDHLPEDDLRSRLLTTLMWLSGHGVKWGDVHSGNIMMRPSTGDIVIIDYGLYRIITGK